MEGKNIVDVCGHPLQYDNISYLFTVVILDMVEDGKKRLASSDSRE